MNCEPTAKDVAGFITKLEAHQGALESKNTGTKRQTREELKEYISPLAEFAQYLQRCQSRYGCENMHTSDVVTWVKESLKFGTGLYPALVDSLVANEFIEEVRRWNSKDARCVSPREYKWQKVQRKVEAHWKKLKKEGEPFPSIHSIQQAIGENWMTIKKAILYSRSLTRAYNKGKPVKKKMKFIDPSKLDYVGPKAGRKGGRSDVSYREQKDSLFEKIKEAARELERDIDPRMSVWGKLVFKNMRHICKQPNDFQVRLLEVMEETISEKKAEILASFIRAFPQIGHTKPSQQCAPFQPQKKRQIIFPHNAPKTHKSHPPREFFLRNHSAHVWLCQRV